jgi:hypothetical protein
MCILMDGFRCIQAGGAWSGPGRTRERLVVACTEPLVGDRTDLTAQRVKPLGMLQRGSVVAVEPAQPLDQLDGCLPLPCTLVAVTATTRTG